MVIDVYLYFALVKIKHCIAVICELKTLLKNGVLLIDDKQNVVEIIVSAVIYRGNCFKTNALFGAGNYYHYCNVGLSTTTTTLSRLTARSSITSHLI